MEGSPASTLVTISDLEGLEELASSWDNFVLSQGASPFLLSGYVKYYMMRCKVEGWTPVLLVETSDSGITGIGAFKTRRRMGVKTAEFLLSVPYSSDFLADVKSEGPFITECMEALFGKQGCQLAELILPSGSPHVDSLRRWSRFRGIGFHSLPPRKLLKHSVLPVQGTWEGFVRSRGREFARHYAKIERKLGENGTQSLVSEEINGPEVGSAIVELDGRSWKEEYRRDAGRTFDPDLELLTGYWKRASPVGLRALPRAYFLELDGRPIAFAIAVILGRTAYLVKTSYDAHFAKLYPGDLIQNYVVRDMFQSGRVTLVDFLTKLPYHRRWTSVYRDRERVRLTKVGLLAALLMMTDSNRTGSRLSKLMLSRLTIIDIP
ncbi:MAG TPA: GNAT family N-acetyltransferase [Conexivisphaerales archaeon]|nr:GNAT family N-acetyltransferase [Conexivisphaerales archaeon]